MPLPQTGRQGPIYPPGLGVLQRLLTGRWGYPDFMEAHKRVSQYGHTEIDPLCPGVSLLQPIFLASRFDPKQVFDHDNQV